MMSDQTDHQINWKAYYEKESEVIDFDPATDPAEVHRCRAAWSVFPAEKVDSILDAGCGDGYFCRWIADKTKAARVTGVDVSEARLARARSRYRGIDYVQGAIEKLPFGDAEFDVVTSIEVLEHQVDPPAALRELARVARRYVVLSVPDRQKLRRELCPHCLKTYPAEGHLHSFDVPRMRELASGAGMVLQRARSYHRPIAPKALPAWLGAALRKLHRSLVPAAGIYLAARMRKA